MRSRQIKSWLCWLYPTALLVLTLGIIYESYSLFQTLNHHRQTEYSHFPYDSFAYISVDLKITFIEPAGSPIPEGTTGEISSRGSGMVIGTTSDGHAAVLTANHVCNPPPFIMSLWNENFEKDMDVTDFYGNVYEAKIILTNLNDDLCLLEVEGFTDPGVKLAEAGLYMGEKVYSVAAPMAFFSPGMVPLLDGYYSGDVFSPTGLNSVYTVPAREGSSGSAILNSDGEIVGIVHSSLTGFQSVTICSTRPQVTAFLLEFEYLLGGILSQ